MSDQYLMSALVGRLVDMNDRSRADRLSARLGEIGFAAAQAPDRSRAALAGVREALRSGRDGDALLGVTAISDPDDLISLYTDRRYAALWPRIAEWAGSDLSAQTRRYLEELRGDWTAADSFETAAPYARRLAAKNAYAAVVGLFLPMFDRVRPYATMRDQQDAGHDGVESLAPVVSRSLAHIGRKDEALALLATVAKSMPADDQGSALNVDGAYLTLAAQDMDWAQVITRADAFLARGRSLGAAINRSALLNVQSWRACALARIGRVAEAEVAAADVLLGEVASPGMAMNMLVCRGDSAAARALLIARLADETTRSWALGFAQPAIYSGTTPLERAMEPVEKAVRTAPDVIAAAQRVGRLLPQPVNKELPAGFDPFRAQPTGKPLGREAI